MNAAVNEVIAHRANELMTGDKTKGGIHPNTHVNMAQSSNDVIPSAKDIVIYWEFDKLVAAADGFATALEAKAQEFADVLNRPAGCGSRNARSDSRRLCAWHSAYATAHKN